MVDHSNSHGVAAASGQNLGEVFFEFQQIGAQVKVCAIHAESGLEVSIIAPSSVSQAQMQTNVLAKLRRRIIQLSS